MTEEFKKYDDYVSNTRRPLVLIAGKPLSQEELKTLIVNEEPIFQMWDEEGRDIAGEKWVYDENLELVDTYINRGYCGTLRNIVHREGFRWLDGWIFCDGTIYGSFYEFKYPEYEEYIDKWEQLARRNPFVDMVAAYTSINEMPCYNCGGLSGRRAILEKPQKRKNDWDNEFHKRSWCEYAYGYCLLQHLPQTCRKAFEKSYDSWNRVAERKYEDTQALYERFFYEEMEFWMLPKEVHRCVEIVLHIHDGIVETLWGEEAKKCYKDYDDKYGDFRLWVTHNSYFYSVPSGDETAEETVFIKFDDEYMRSCFRFMGLSEGIYDEQIKPKYLIDIKAKRQVVTREWLIAEYEKHFKDTELDIENVNRWLKK